MSDLIPVQAYDGSMFRTHFYGIRNRETCEVSQYIEGRPAQVRALELADALKWRQHHTGAFDWGYMGSAPRQLALAILLAVGFDVPTCVQFYTRFCESYVRHFPADSWQLGKATIILWLNRIKATERQPGDE